MVTKPALTQLSHYLGRAWIRAAIPVQLHDDSTQAVYETLLEKFGRDRFDLLLADIDRRGIRDALNRETADGPDFFRVIDAVKKRAQREKTFRPLESACGAAVRVDFPGDLAEAIGHALTHKEAALIHATLSGQKPAEIAAEWGVAPKTISNEKTRAIQKLRVALTN